MLEGLSIRNAAHFREVDIAFGPRLNVITGDNSLGKTVLLDLVWRAITGEWAGRPVNLGKEESGIYGKISQKITNIVDDNYSINLKKFSRNQLALDVSRSAALVSSDRSCNIWIKSKNKKNSKTITQHISEGIMSTYSEDVIIRTFVLGGSEVWLGKKNDDFIECGGILNDVLRWKLEEDPAAEALQNVLDILSPPDEPLRLYRRSVRPFAQEARNVPALETKRGLIPLTLASEAIKRIVSIAYLLVWTRQEQKIYGGDQEFNPWLSLIVDELEAHLHPRWQRTIAPSLLSLANNKALFGETPQLFFTTHSPLVLASLEAHIDPQLDKLFHLRLTEEGDAVTVEELPWEKHNDIAAWVTSDVFGLSYAGSREVEALRHDITTLQAQDVIATADVESVSQRVRNLLHEADVMRADWFDWVERRTA